MFILYSVIVDVARPKRAYLQYLTMYSVHHRIGQSAVRHLEVSYDGGVVRRTEVSYDGGVVRHLEVSYDGGVV